MTFCKKHPIADWTDGAFENASFTLTTSNIEEENFEVALIDFCLWFRKILMCSGFYRIYVYMFGGFLSCLPVISSCGSCFIILLTNLYLSFFYFTLFFIFCKGEFWMIFSLSLRGTVEKRKNSWTSR